MENCKNQNQNRNQNQNQQQETNKQNKQNKQNQQNQNQKSHGFKRLAAAFAAANLYHLKRAQLFLSRRFHSAPRRVFFAAYTPPQKSDFILFAPCAARTL